MIVLMPHCGFLSETSRLLAIADALRARGAEVLVASHGGPFAHLLGTPDVDWIRLTSLADGVGSQQRFVRGITSWGGENLPLYDDSELRACVAAETAFLREVGAELVHIGFTLSAYLSSRAVGIPISTSHVGSFVDPILDAGLAPVPVTLTDPNLARLPSWLRRRAVNVVPRLLTQPAAQVNALADELGLPRVAGLMGFMSGDLVLVTDTAEALGIPAARVEQWHAGWLSRGRRDATYRLTGPLFAHLDLPLPNEVDEFLSRHEGEVVHVSASSVSAEVLRGIVASAQRSGAPVVVSATLHDIDDLRDERTCVAGILPNHLVMPRAAAAVIMGGQGTVQTAMASATPFVGLPLHPEQELNVAVAERLGCALRLPPASAGSDRLTQAIARVLGDAAFSRAARTAAKLYAGVDGAGLAADAILEFLRVTHPRAVAPPR